MITFYVSDTCPFSKKVLDVANELAVPYIAKDIHDPNVAPELLRLGGEIQTPYMTDDEAHISMYESDGIISYLHQRFGTS